jgi:hypothetical protein
MIAGVIWLPWGQAAWLSALFGVSLLFPVWLSYRSWRADRRYLPKGLWEPLGSTTFAPERYEDWKPRIVEHEEGQL